MVQDSLHEVLSNIKKLDRFAQQFNVVLPILDLNKVMITISKAYLPRAHSDGLHRMEKDWPI